jgi:hypothetical protein
LEDMSGISYLSGEWGPCPNMNRRRRDIWDKMGTLLVWSTVSTTIFSGLDTPVHVHTSQS